MSMQICVFSDMQLNSTAEWQQAIDAESLPLRLSYGKPLAQVRGFVPAYLGEKRTGFECRHRKPGDILDAYPEIDFGRAWKYVMSFGWGADLDEMQAAWMAAAAYARGSSGVVFDEQEGKLLTPEEALQIARDLERTAPEAEAVLRNLMQQFPLKP